MTTTCECGHDLTDSMLTVSLCSQLFTGNDQYDDTDVFGETISYACPTCGATVDHAVGAFIEHGTGAA